MLGTLKQRTSQCWGQRSLIYIKCLKRIQSRHYHDLPGASEDTLDLKYINGSYGGRILAEDKSRSPPHLNVLGLIGRPRLQDLLPIKSNILLRNDEEVELVEKSSKLTSWNDSGLNDSLETLETAITGLKSLNQGEQVTILGGGISGLFLAWILALGRPDLQISVLEASDRFGGYMDSEAVNVGDHETFFEWGPRTLQAQHLGTLLIRLMVSMKTA